MWRTVVVDGERYENYEVNREGYLRSRKTGRGVHPNRYTGAVHLSKGPVHHTKLGPDATTRSLATIMLETFRGRDPHGRGRPHFLNKELSGPERYCIDNLMWQSELYPPGESVLPGDEAAMSMLKLFFTKAEIGQLRWLAARDGDRNLGRYVSALVRKAANLKAPAPAPPPSSNPFE